ncbi:MAG: prepilin-type N-terminal cleavage/methylation domain-containing protein [Psychromonas sp.]|nr:prepilin-type N-terminal cleavage/methylation domain-containing protein [Psychromonas sp.]
MLRGYRGFSLVELLITLLLGSVLLTMVISLYVTSVSTGAKSLKYSRLRTDLQAIIALMETDIRRAGYGGSEFMVGSGANKTIDINPVSKDCIVYYYNYKPQPNPAIASDEPIPVPVPGDPITHADKMGFRFNKDNDEIQYGTGVDPLAANCYDSGSWEALNDRNFIKITDLVFTESESAGSSPTMRSVQIDITGELVSEAVSHSISTKIQVRNLEFN